MGITRSMITQHPCEEKKMKMSLKFFMFLFAACAVEGLSIVKRPIPVPPVWERWQNSFQGMVYEISSLWGRMNSAEIRLDARAEGLPLPSRRVRLSNNGRSHLASGRVEVYHEGEWGTVCDDGLEVGKPMGTTVATVVCKSLGFSHGAPLPPQSSSSSKTIWMDEVRCNGHEESLFHCFFDSAYDSNNCSHSEDFR